MPFHFHFAISCIIAIDTPLGHELSLHWLIRLLSQAFDFRYFDIDIDYDTVSCFHCRQMPATLAPAID
jgi:hypothetical protein